MRPALFPALVRDLPEFGEGTPQAHLSEGRPRLSGPCPLVSERLAVWIGWSPYLASETGQKALQALQPGRLTRRETEALKWSQASVPHPLSVFPGEDPAFYPAAEARSLPRPFPSSPHITTNSPAASRLPPVPLKSTRFLVPPATARVQPSHLSSCGMQLHPDPPPASSDRPI